MSFGVVLLAAGGSSRLGRAKQLLPYLGRTLVEHAARTALASGRRRSWSWSARESAAVREALRGLRVRIVPNDAWAEGMGGSIARGVAALGEDVETAVVALGDQPRITPAHLRTLAERVGAGKPIVASSYDGVLGAPCAFARSEFARLRSLSGDMGARHLVRSGEEPVEAVAFAGANLDVDTPEDVRLLVPEAEDAPTDAYDETDDARAPPVG